MPPTAWEQTHFTLFSEVFSRVQPKAPGVRPSLECIAGAALNTAGGLLAVFEQDEQLRTLGVERRLCDLPTARRFVSVMLPTMAYALFRTHPTAIQADLVDEAVR